MSEADRMLADVDANGVKVRKALNLEDFAVPSLVFTVIGPSDAAATVVLRDPIPEEIGIGDIGFHPKHGGEYWQYEEDHVTFSRQFDPGEKFTTVYGVIGADPSADDWFSADPSVELSGADPGRIERAGAAESGVAGRGGGEGDAALLRQIARELEERDDSAAHVDEIRDVLIGDVDVALAELNEEVAALREAVGSMQGTTSEERVPEEVSELPAAVESIRARLADLETEVSERAEDDLELATLAGRLDTVEDEVVGDGDPSVGSRDRGSLSDRISEVEAEIERLTGHRSDETLDDVRSEVERLASDLEETEAGMQRNARDIDDVGTEVAELVAMVESPSEERSVDADRLAEIEARFDEMAETLDEVVAFQERLSETLLAMDAT